MAPRNRTIGLRDRVRDRCAVLVLAFRAGLAAAGRARLGATNGGFPRPEMLMLVLPGPVSWRNSTLLTGKCRDPDAVGFTFYCAYKLDIRQALLKN